MFCMEAMIQMGIRLPSLWNEGFFGECIRPFRLEKVMPVIMKMLKHADIRNIYINELD